MTEFNEAAQAKYGIQDYGPRPQIEGLEIIDLRRFNDDGGAMTELARLSDGKLAGVEGFVARQVNYSTMDPQAIKAFHLHDRQTDVWYVPPSDKLLLCVGDVRAGSPSEGVVQRIVLGRRELPPRAHPARAWPTARRTCASTATSAIIYFVDVQFSVGEDCDEGRLPWDHFGTEIWDVERG